MILILLAYLGGVLTIVSPCILPVLPFVFARADRPFVRNGLPMLAGMALTFAGVATLAAVAGGWAVAANHYGRVGALLLLSVFGVSLLMPSVSARLTRPVVSLGTRLSQTADRAAETSILSSLVLGVAVGLLWAPCAGPVLGVILTGAALQGASFETTLLLLTYAAGAATSLALALLVGGRVLTAMKRSLGAGEWVRRGLGAAIVIAVACIALGLDTGFLTRVSLASTTSLEQGLLTSLEGGEDAESPATVSANPTEAMQAIPASQARSLRVEGTLPELSGAVEWLNSPPLTAEGLRGKVVLIDFWTYSCINCLRAIPYVRAWAEKFKGQGLVVIGVHAPEFAFEKNVDNVKKAVADLAIRYPVAIDNGYAIWRAFDNRYWPAHYFVDAQGRIRHHHFGEGSYGESELVIQQLLTEAGTANVSEGSVAVSASGAEAPADKQNALSPETYIGADRAENFVSPGGAVADRSHVYNAQPTRLNEWGLKGKWTIGSEHASLDRKDGSIVFRFHSRDLHLVLGPGGDGKPVRFNVTIDGAAPGESHGADVDANGQGVVTGQRLYQLVRQVGAIEDRTFEIRFLDAGVEAFAFTFG
jgi:cytochrome c biogenesis protein CcdA/thiol-disulfide isomerase/thioredoxin